LRALPAAASGFHTRRHADLRQPAAREQCWGLNQHSAEKPRGT
jgi:hypothetical protein